MLKFEDELEKFKPVLEVNQIESQIASEDMRDVIDLIKQSIGEKALKQTSQNEFVDKEL